MSSTKGVIDEIFVENGSTKARVIVDGSITTVSLILLRSARVGDELTIGSGIALSVIESKTAKRNEHVLSYPR